MELGTARRAPDAGAVRKVIALELDNFLRKTRLRRLYFADSSVAPPPLAYITHFSRLSVPLEGSHAMDLPVGGRSERILPARGHAVFVPGHAWNRPDWADRVKVLTFLFGAKQIGISLVTHRGGDESKAQAIKTSVASAHDALSRNILNGLAALAGETPAGPLPRLLAESLLHSCLRLLRAPEGRKPRKAMRTYETLCLYVQENFQQELTRESVAQRLEIAPAHVSRLFRREGLMRFNDYVNLVRINRAKFILANYRIPLKEVAASCGYADVAYFCRVFKRFAKATPGQYRDRGR
jgi:AraC-like DNA-binding protein